MLLSINDFLPGFFFFFSVVIKCSMIGVNV